MEGRREGQETGETNDNGRLVQGSGNQEGEVRGGDGYCQKGKESDEGGEEGKEQEGEGGRGVLEVPQGLRKGAKGRESRGT